MSTLRDGSYTDWLARIVERPCDAPSHIAIELEDTAALLVALPRCRAAPRGCRGRAVPT